MLPKPQDLSYTQLVLSFFILILDRLQALGSFVIMPTPFKRCYHQVGLLLAPQNLQYKNIPFAEHFSNKDSKHFTHIKSAS